MLYLQLLLSISLALHTSLMDKRWWTLSYLRPLSLCQLTCGTVLEMNLCPKSQPLTVAVCRMLSNVFVYISVCTTI